MLLDIGKCSEEFFDYIKRSSGERLRPITDSLPNLSPTRSRGTTPAFLTSMGSLCPRSLSVNSFSETALDSIWRSDIAPDVTGLLPSFCWVRESENDPTRLKAAARAKAAFQHAFLGCMIFSCLVDADFKDTEQFYAGIEGREVDREWPALQSLLPGLVAAFEQHMNERRDMQTPVDRLRAQILDAVRARAGDPPGLVVVQK